MKRILLLLAILCSLTAFAQMPKLKPELLKGYDVKINDLSTSMLEYDGGYKDFYADEATLTTYKKGSKSTTDPNALKGRTFKVADITSSTGYMATYYKFKLEGNGETVYYKYQKGYNAPFTPLNFTLPADYYCDYIVKGMFDETIISYTVEEKYVFAISKYKFVDGSSVVYNLSLQTGKDGEGIGGRGVTLELENNKKIQKDALVEKNAKGPTPIYNTEFVLTEAELELLKANKIKSFTLFKTQAVMFDDSATTLQKVIPCLITIK